MPRRSINAKVRALLRAKPKRKTLLKPKSSDVKKLIQLEKKRIKLLQEKNKKSKPRGSAYFKQ